MRRFEYALVGVLVSVIAVPMADAAPKKAAAKADKAWTDCTTKVPFEAKVAGCAEVIARGTGETAPRRGTAYNNRGNALYGKGDYDAALRDLDSALLLDPSISNAYNNRGLVYRAKGDLDRAMAEFGLAIAKNPKNAVALTNRGQAYTQKRDTDRALRDLDAAIAADPKYAAAYINRGIANNFRNDSDAAIRDFDQGLALDPNLAFGYSGRANARNAKGDFARALEDFDKALALNPKLTSAYSERGFAWLGRGDAPRANQDFEEALKLNPKSVGALNGRGYAAKAAGNLTQAIADFDEALRIDGKSSTAYAYRGDAYLKMGENDRAMADLNEAIRLDPMIATARVGRGILYERAGDMARARSEFEAAVAMPLRAYSVTARAARETARARLAGVTPTLTPAAVATPTPVAPSTPPPAAAPYKFTAPVERGPRVALVIGNGAYRNASPLPNPSNDARLISQSLRELGFKVIEGHDLDSGAMRSKIAEFGAAMSGAGVTMLFYAGHGMQVAGKNYLIPVDARLERPSALSTEAIEVGTILSDMETEKRINLVFLDACRNNPLAGKMARSFGEGRALSAPQGLAQQSAGIGTLIAFATSPEMIALDGTGADSPFTLAIVKHIKTPNLEIRSMLTRVRADVIEATREQQVPWDHSSLTGEFYFRPLTN